MRFVFQSVLQEKGGYVGKMRPTVLIRPDQKERARNVINANGFPKNDGIQHVKKGDFRSVCSTKYKIKH